MPRDLIVINNLKFFWTHWREQTWRVRRRAGGMCEHNVWQLPETVASGWRGEGGEMGDEGVVDYEAQLSFSPPSSSSCQDNIPFSTYIHWVPNRYSLRPYLGLALLRTAWPTGKLFDRFTHKIGKDAGDAPLGILCFRKRIPLHRICRFKVRFEHHEEYTSW